VKKRREKNDGWGKAICTQQKQKSGSTPTPTTRKHFRLKTLLGVIVPETVKKRAFLRLIT
jgi:hypothetical protein